MKCWNINSQHDKIDSVGEEVLGKTAQEIHEDELSPYKMGYLGEQLVLWREDYPGEAPAAIIVLTANTGTPEEYQEDSYIPPTVPTEP